MDKTDSSQVKYYVADNNPQVPDKQKALGIFINNTLWALHDRGVLDTVENYLLTILVTDGIVTELEL